MKFEGIFVRGMWVPCEFVGPIRDGCMIAMHIHWPRRFREIAAEKGVEIAE
jgi:hypothetical protein